MPRTRPCTTTCAPISDCGLSSTGFMSVRGGTPQARACSAWARPISPPSAVTAALFDMFCGLNGRTARPRCVYARASPAVISDLPTSEPVPCSISARAIPPLDGGRREPLTSVANSCSLDGQRLPQLIGVGVGEGLVDRLQRADVGAGKRGAEEDPGALGETDDVRALDVGATRSAAAGFTERGLRADSELRRRIDDLADGVVAHQEKDHLPGLRSELHADAAAGQAIEGGIAPFAVGVPSHHYPRATLSAGTHGGLENVGEDHDAARVPESGVEEIRRVLLPRLEQLDGGRGLGNERLPLDVGPRAADAARPLHDAREEQYQAESLAHFRSNLRGSRLEPGRQTWAHALSGRARQGIIKAQPAQAF